MRFLLLVCATLLLLSAISFSEGEQQFADLGACKVQSGETIQDCRIGYRTWGKLDERKSNVVVLLTWFTGTSEQLAGQVGAKEYVDPEKYFIVALDALADGVSSSPSNSKTQPHLKFPQITIADMVETQHRVLTETLKLDKIHAIVGGSMGGMQAFQWSVQYPEFMDMVVAITGSPKLTPHDLLLWRAERNAILDSREFNNGNYEPPLRIAAVDDMHQLELETPHRLNDEIRSKDYDEAVKKIESSDNFDPSDRVRQLEAMMSHDMYKNFNGQAYPAAHSTKAKFLIIVADQDHMVNPQPALAFAEMLLIAPMQLNSYCGHLAPVCQHDEVVPVVQHALAMK